VREELDESRIATIVRRTDFHDLLIWQKSKLICLDLYRATSKFPDHEKYGIVSQIRRAALSVPVNIAEGHGRSSDEDFARFLYISLGSLRELETLVEISGELEYFEESQLFLARIGEVSKMLQSFLATVKSG
jgi:four helix bundle protein